METADKTAFLMKPPVNSNRVESSSWEGEGKREEGRRGEGRGWERKGWEGTRQKEEGGERREKIS